MNTCHSPKASTQMFTAALFMLESHTLRSAPTPLPMQGEILEAKSMVSMSSSQNSWHPGLYVPQ
jgi:hypothetical protein